MGNKAQVNKNDEEARKLGIAAAIKERRRDKQMYGKTSERDSGMHGRTYKQGKEHSLTSLFRA
jgi:hypothetical protein